MTCREVADFIADYLTGDLSAEAREVFDYHLSRCPNCLSYLANYEATITLGRRAFEDQDAASESAGVSEELVKAILAARPR